MPLEFRERMSEMRKGEGNPFYGIRGIKNKLSQWFVITWPDETEKIVVGIRNFCNTYNKEVEYKERLYRGCLTDIAKGKRTSTHKGYMCRYYDKEKDIGIPVWMSKTQEGYRF